MMKDSLIHFNDGQLIVFGFLLFVVVFFGVLVWTFLIQKSKFYENLSHIPLVDGEDHGQ
jgi:hypothetical protein